MGRKTFRKQTTSPKLIDLINPKNISLMENFLKIKSVTTSNKTITVYKSNLNIFFCWNQQFNGNKFFVEIKKIEIADFFSYASEELKLGSSRLNNLRSTLSSLSNFIERFMDEEYPSFHNKILLTIESSPKELRREKTILTDEQIENLLEYLSDKNKQQACWLALAVTSGARFSELLNFEVDLIDENKTAFGDLFLETVRQIKTKGRGKSGKLLYKYILKDKFLPFYNNWLLERKDILEKNKIEHNYLFIKDDGSRATDSTIRTWVAEFENYLKVPFYTHAVRHYFVTLLSRKNIPYHLIQAIVGWEDSSMVEIYNDSTIGEKSFPELENLRNL